MPLGLLALRASIRLGAGQLDWHVRGGADHARTSIGIAVASERFQQQNEFLRQNERRLKKNAPSRWVRPAALKFNQLKREQSSAKGGTQCTKNERERGL